MNHLHLYHEPPHQKKSLGSEVMRLATVFVCLLAGAMGQSPAAGPPNGAAAAYREGAVLLGFHGGTSPAQQKAALDSVGAVETRQMGAGVRLLRVPPGRAVSDAVRSLRARPEVRYAEPDFVQYIDGGPLPNDTGVGQQWAVQNTGQTVNGVTGTPGADERSLAAWGITTGANSVVVAVLDTGVQYTHPDLVTNMWSNPGGINGCPAGTHGFNVLTSTCDPMDDDVVYGGHGTHVAGILGAVGNNAAGIAGVGWTTSILAVRWVNGSTGTGFTSDLIVAMDWVLQAKQAGVNVRVVNDSATWPGTAFSQALADEIDLLGANDILFVAAAGNTAENNDTTPRYPCSYDRPNMICVGASDQHDNLWSSSNYGFSTVKLAAPGVNIYSTLRLNNYGYISGGSMAAPQVSGAAALILSLGYQAVGSLRSMILENVDPLASLTGLVATGGRLNVCKATPGCASAVEGTPVNLGLPVVTGVPRYGSVLGASTGRWSGIPTSFSYQWYRCDSGGLNCSPITGATGQSYALLASSDAGATFAVAVTASNTAGSQTAQSGVSAVAAAQASPFGITSTIQDGAVLGGSLLWEATPSQGVKFVQFYIDGVLSQTVSTSPYVFNQGTTGMLDTTTLTNGAHVLGIRALAADNRTYGFYGATVTVTNVPGGGGGIALVQSNALRGTGVPSISVPFGSANTAGNLIIAVVRMSTTSQTVTVTDSAGNSYTDAVAQPQSADGHQVHVFYAKNVAGGANTVTATFSATNNRPWLAVYEYSGLSTTSPLDRTANAQGSGSAPSSGATATTVSANELVFAALGLPGSYTGTVAAGSGYVLQLQDTGSSRSANEAAVVTSTGSYAGTFSLSAGTNWTAVVATFAAAGAPPPSPPTITTTALPGGTQGVAYTATLTATGGTTPYSWSIVSGTLPAGLTLGSSTGVISGPPSGSGTSTFDVQVSDANTQTAVKTLSLTIAPSGGGGGIALVQSNALRGTGVPSISVPFGSANTAGNLIIAVVRMSTTSQTVTVTDSAGNSYTDAVAQPQSADGHQVHVFYAKNVAGGANTVTATFSATNNRPWLAVYEYSGLSATSPLDRTANAQGSGTAPSSGATATTVSANELVFAALGLPGSYTGTVAAGSGYVLQLQDTGSSRAATEAAVVTSTGSYAGTFSLSAGTNWTAVVATFAAAGAPPPNPPTITTTALPGGTQGVAYTATLTATGGTTPYSWSIVSGTLPAGLTLGSGTGMISGTPSGSGTSTFDVQVSDANTQTAVKTLSLTIAPSGGGGGIALVQSNALRGTGVPSISVPFGSANTAGNLIIAVVRMSTTSQTVTVTDSAGNSYTDAVAQPQSADGHQVHVFYAKNIAGGANTVTATFSATNNRPWLAVYEYSGLSATSPLDRTANAQGSGSAPSSGATATTVSANELVFAAVGLPANYKGTVAAGSGYVLQLQDTGISRAATEAAVVTSTGSYAGTFSLSAGTNWTSVVATFKP